MKQEIDFKHLRKALADSGCQNIDEIAAWTHDGVDEADVLRRSNYNYNKLAHLLMQAHQDEIDA